jgi:hypothetical protein
LNFGRVASPAVWYTKRGGHIKHTITDKKQITRIENCQVKTTTTKKESRLLSPVDLYWIKGGIEFDLRVGGGG